MTLLVLLDLAVARSVADLIQDHFGIRIWLHSDPPICLNRSGAEVSCSYNDVWVDGVAILVFGAIFLGSLWIERRRRWL